MSSMPASVSAERTARSSSAASAGSDAADVGTRRALLSLHPPSWVLGAPNNAATLDLDSPLFHLDYQFGKMEEIRKAFGPAVTIKVYAMTNVRIW